MARIVVDVMLKPEILTRRVGYFSRAASRIGVDPSWMFARASASELTVEGEATEEHLAPRRKEPLVLSNPVIEDVVNVSVLED